MKSLIIAFFISLLTFSTVSAQESSLKVAYVNSDSVLVSMPEYPTQMKIYESYTKQLQAQLESKQTEFQQKYQEFQTLAQAGTTIPAVLQDKQKELQQLNQNLQEFAQQSQGRLQLKEQELIKPLYDKIQASIKEIAQSKNLDYVVESQMFLFSVPKHDITSEVIAKLGGTAGGGN